MRFPPWVSVWTIVAPSDRSDNKTLLPFPPCVSAKEIRSCLSTRARLRRQRRLAPPRRPTKLSKGGALRSDGDNPHSNREQFRIGFVRNRRERFASRKAGFTNHFDGGRNVNRRRAALRKRIAFEPRYFCVSIRCHRSERFAFGKETGTFFPISRESRFPR
jgi:hypothetical protein